MISIENLYTVLYANLLQPVGFDCCYYYPFGTTQNLSYSGEFQLWRPKHDHHVLFHFEQEPLLTTDLGGLYDAVMSFSSSKICKLLANSEHSKIKKKICRDRSMLDWYFFYHGLAALDWFRDAQYIPDMHQPRKVFSSLNHIVTGKRSYRMALTARLLDAGVCDHGDISFHSLKSHCAKEVESAHSYLSEPDKKNITRHILNSTVPLPMTLDSHIIDGSFSARFGHQEYRLWQNSLMHVVNETVFYDAKLHLTEKVFKPIVSLRPFILAAAPGNLAYLKRYGFQTFDTWIDEGYDEITDNDQRLAAITHEISRLCACTPSELADMHKDMMSVLKHNKNHFFTTFRDLIMDELVDNFDACVRIWNNGRINQDRVIPRNYDVDLVKKILKQ